MRPHIRIKTLIAGAALATLGLGTMAQAETTTLTLSSWVPPTHFLVKDVLQPWMADVEKATEGRVKINMLPKAVGSPPQHWELARKGVADITWGNFTYEPERFKAMWFAELPMMGDNCPPDEKMALQVTRLQNPARPCWTTSPRCAPRC